MREEHATVHIRVAPRDRDELKRRADARCAPGTRYRIADVVHELLRGPQDLGGAERIAWSSAAVADLAADEEVAAETWSEP